ncbi:hypothetical protein BZA77DRAFT_248134 [Pyronema omphalodes]|nr:hypothetical protein BZA77DRAFT_248134 [Pyronema omphalodes]
MNVVTTYPPRRKAIRAAQACDACRARKAKCDEGRPSCGFCKESQVICVYREVPPPKQDRTLLQILDRLGRVETLLDTLNSKTETQTPRSDGSPNRASIKPAAIQTPATPTTAPPTNRPNPPGSPPDDDEQLTIPYQHTTAADKLLRWPTIRKLIDPELLKQKTYALDEEQNRGTIRVYGRGEENVSGGDANFEESDCSYPSSTNWNMLYPAAGNEWDGGGGENNRTGDTILDDSNMPDGNGELNPELQDYGVGGLGPNGELRLDMQTVQELLNSYFSNIHILHPILDKATITQSVYRFADLFNALPQGNAQSNGLGLDNDTNGVNTSPRNPRNNSIIGKRKRSDSIPRSLQVSSSTASQRPIPRTVHSALVLLVLALGAVCLHRRPIPGPLPTKARYPDLFMETTSPFGCSTTPGYTDISQYSQQPLAGSGTKPELRNVDVIPGLAYFSQAMDILGLLIGSNELESVQAGLLAGLYWAQMARILDSWKWISWACMGCQILVRTKLKSEKNPHRKDLILRAFWTCLQLESDFLAELDLPPSGISRMEDEMSMPSGIPSQDKSHLDSPNSLAIARELDYQLEAWKSHLPAPLRWEANDPPSSDINAARLRAKYYSARYIIHRPFVYHALHGIDVPGGLGNYLNPDSPTLDEQTSERRGELTPNELEMDCRKCLEAAMKSTSAFHKFDPEKSRPIITNVFGTAHAQFGTLLVLQAAYQSRALRGIVSRGVLADLVKKTLPWLRTLAPISPALKRDLAILENALAKLDLP